MVPPYRGRSTESLCRAYTTLDIRGIAVIISDMKAMRFQRITERVYASEDFAYFIDKTPEGWVVSEHGVPKNRFRTINEAKAWTRAWVAGETIAPPATIWYRNEN